jgi:hypothetical protein
VHRALQAAGVLIAVNRQAPVIRNEPLSEITTLERESPPPPPAQWRKGA